MRCPWSDGAYSTRNPQDAQIDLTEHQNSAFLCLTITDGCGMMGVLLDVSVPSPGATLWGPEAHLSGEGVDG